jgi:V/A-type H+-transporting ATPase subunit K
MRIDRLRLAVAVMAAVAVALSGLLWVSLPAGAAETAVAGAVDPGIVQWALMAAAGAAGLGTIAAGIAVASVGSAAIGALAEKPELLGRVLIIVGLAEGIAIYGLIVAILILNRAG